LSILNVLIQLGIRIGSAKLHVNNPRIPIFLTKIG
jgi:hypothetical protein